MYFVTDRGWAVVLMMGSLWCLGTWPVFFNVAERRGRLPQHTYIDYAISTFIVAILFALTLGQIGECTESEPNFFRQLSQENGPSIAVAMAGGVALCLGNICMQYALVFVGISLTEVISASLAVIIGTTTNYFLDGGLNRAEILFPGVGCFVIAVILGSFCHASNTADIKNRSRERRLQDSNLHHILLHNQRCYEKSESGEHSQSIREIEEQISLVEEARAVKVRDASTIFGLGLAMVAGCCYGFFSPLFNIATNDQFHLLREGVPHLVVYTSFFYFSVAFLVLAVMANVYLLYYPILGLPTSSITAYVSDWRGRGVAVMAGVVCGLGNGFQFMGGQAAGYAAADAVQALPLVGTLWGILLFGEYHHSSSTTYSLLSAMLLMFTIAVGLLIASSNERP